MRLHKLVYSSSLTNMCMEDKLLLLNVIVFDYQTRNLIKLFNDEILKCKNYHSFLYVFINIFLNKRYIYVLINLYQVKINYVYVCYIMYCDTTSRQVLFPVPSLHKIVFFRTALLIMYTIFNTHNIIYNINV